MGKTVDSEIQWPGFDYYPSASFVILSNLLNISETEFPHL